MRWSVISGAGYVENGLQVQGWKDVGVYQHVGESWVELDLEIVDIESASAFDSIPSAWT